MLPELNSKIPVPGVKAAKELRSKEEPWTFRVEDPKFSPPPPVTTLPLTVWVNPEPRLRVPALIVKVDVVKAFVETVVVPVPTWNSLKDVTEAFGT